LNAEPFADEKAERGVDASKSDGATIIMKSRKAWEVSSAKFAHVLNARLAMAGLRAACCCALGSSFALLTSQAFLLFMMIGAPSDFTSASTPRLCLSSRKRSAFKRRTEAGIDSAES